MLPLCFRHFLFKNALAILDGSQHFDISYLHGRHRRGVCRKDDEICMFARGQAALLMFFKILVCRVNSDGAHCIQRADTLLRAQRNTLLGNTVHSAPDGFHN